MYRVSALLRAWEMALSATAASLTVATVIGSGLVVVVVTGVVPATEVFACLVEITVTFWSGLPVLFFPESEIEFPRLVRLC